MGATDAINVVTILKTMFNQSGALFVLITANDLFEKILESAKERKKEYTLFSKKVFLQRPNFYDISKFMDRIVEPTVRQPGEKALFHWDEIPKGEAIQFRKLLNENTYDEDLENLSNVYVWKSEDDNIDLSGLNISSHIQFDGADLVGTNFRAANLEYIDVSSANLLLANLESANLSNTDLSNCNLYGTNLKNATLSRSRLVKLKL